tara:strand:- start:4383 stop:4529 length:147 start_codon:yes stop_codon:yes gene_type:complete
MAKEPRWLSEDKARLTDLAKWYIDDGRGDPNHPKHGVYKGLAKKYKDK